MRKKKDTIEVINEDNTVEEVSTESWFCSRGYTPPNKWDWKLIRKEWNKLKMPKDVVYDPFHIPLDVNNINHASYYWLFSKRGVGKTTTMLILGLILFKLYGVVTQYIRQKEDQLRPIYHDDPYMIEVTDDYGNTEAIQCQSGITLVPVDFDITEKKLYTLFEQVQAYKQGRIGDIYA